MKSKDIIELLSEFLDLNWKWDKKKEWGEKLSDLKLYPGVWLRKWRGDWNIEYLPIGTKMKIPSPWPSIWSEFCVWGGGRVQDWISETNPEEIESNQLLNFCTIFFKLCTCIENRLCGESNFEEMWEYNINELCKINTKVFRDWLKNEHDLVIEPWEIENYEYGKKDI